MPDVPGFQLGFLLTGTFRALVDEVHAELAAQGHPGLRPSHGFALQAIGSGVTAVELGHRLGVSKQAAGKTIEGLEKLGYVTRAEDETDARRRVVSVSPRGSELLALSAAAFERVTAKWRAELGPDTYRAMVSGLDRLGRVHGGLDLGSWMA